MDPSHQWVLISLAIFLVFLNGYFVAIEFAIVKVRRTRLQELIQKGQKRARTALRLVDDMDEYLSATQLGITLASLGLGWIGEPAFAALFEPAFASLGPFKIVMAHSLAIAAAFMLITFLHIVLGELAPKSLAIQQAEVVSVWGAPFLIGFYWLTYPLIWALNGTANSLLRVVGVPSISSGSKAHSQEELRMIVAHSHREGVIEGEAKKLLNKVLDFSNRSVRQVMVPSPEVIYLDVRNSLEENLELARRHRHTRFPVCDGSLEKVLGVVHTKDIFWTSREQEEDFQLSMAQRPVKFVPDTKPIKDLLTEFRKAHTHIAVSVDEFGSTVGIITMEDILEELVGEIQDEFDPDAPGPEIRRLENGFLIQGRTLLSALEKHLEISLQDEDNDTIAGHILMRLGRMAEVGDEVVVADRFKARVLGIRGFQITDLRFEEVTPQRKPG